MIKKQLKPPKLIDVKISSSQRLNLSSFKKNNLPIKTGLKVILCFSTIFLVISFAQAPAINRLISSAQTTKTPEEERQILEQQLKELEKQMDEYQNQIETYRTKGQSLKNEISILNAKINKLNLQIKAININLANLEQDINSTQQKINLTENKIEKNKNALAYSLMILYETDNQNILQIILANDRISDFFRNVNNLMLVQQNIRSHLEEISKLREDLLNQKEELAAEKTDVENLKAFQIAQKQTAADIRLQKTKLLKETKGKESEYQKLLKNTKETAAQIRNRIFELLGGGELTFEKAYEYAKLAEQATGVRAAFLLAILDRESLFGRNVGKCNYKNAMRPSEIPVFLEIVQSLHLDPDNLTVSCPNKDGYYGGAMGPAQFLPSTWKKYQDQVSQITHNNPASPWNNADAFVAAALYLKDVGADSNSLAAERAAAAKYYAGNRWRNYLWTYGDRVVAKAQQFQSDIDTLNS